MILSLRALAAAGLAASVATGGAIATRTPSGDQPPAATAGPAAPADVLTTLAVGEEARFSAADAGEVVVVRTADELELKSVIAAAGWLQEVEEAAGPEIEVKFFANGRRVDLNIELEDGSIRVRVRQRFDDDGHDVGDDDTTTSTVPTTATTGTVAPIPAVPSVTVQTAGEAGTVTLSISGGVITVTNVGTNAGWVAETEQGVGREVEVSFRSGLRRIDFKAELEDGRLETEVRERIVDLQQTPVTTNPTTPTTSPTTSTTFDDRDDNFGDDDRDDGHDDNSGPGGGYDDNSGPGGGDDDNSGPGGGGDDH